MATAATKLRNGLRDKLTAKIGESVTFHNLSSAAYTVSSGDVDPSSGTATAVITPPGAYKTAEVNGTTILASDARTFLAAKDATFTPEVGAFIVRGDATEWVVEDVNEISMGNGTTATIAGWSLHIRRN